jgi:CheY-like chemotaxis protein
MGLAVDLSGHANVIAVGSVFEALDLFRSQQFEVVLVDFDLDDGKDDVFVRRVREMDRSFPIVAISAHADGNDALVRAGCRRRLFQGQLSEHCERAPCSAPTRRTDAWRTCR